MANKPTVTMTFAGDGGDLEKAIDEVGGAARELQGDFGKAEGASDDLRQRFDQVGKAARDLDTDITKVDVKGLNGRLVTAAAAGDIAERSFMGVADTMDVMAKRMGLPLGPASDLVRDFADLGGAGAALIPLINAQTLAWLASNAAMLLSVGAFLALGVGIGLLIVHWDSIVAKVPALGTALGGLTGAFTNVINGATGVKDWIILQFDAVVTAAGNLPGRIGGAVSGLWDGIWSPLVGISMWLTDRWNAVVGEVQALPGRVGTAALGMWDGIWNAFAGVYNRIVGAWNNFSFTIDAGEFLGYDIPGFTLNTPDLPLLQFHQGGRVRGGPTSESLALLRGGERVLRPAEPMPGGNTTINITALDGRDVIRLIEEYERRNGQRFARAS